ncbi:hypothetical protein BX600DRAFT_509423 [Xylariales sp. PMI_506]|nr:hypothetical protein BX600DRAFT_509423 [Xylariales sp. PMI_506]
MGKYTFNYNVEPVPETESPSPSDISLIGNGLIGNGSYDIPISSIGAPTEPKTTNAQDNATWPSGVTFSKNVVYSKLSNTANTVGVYVSDFDGMLTVNNRHFERLSFFIFPGAPSFATPEIPSTLYIAPYQCSKGVNGPSGEIQFVIKDPILDESQEYQKKVYLFTGHAHGGIEIGTTMSSAVNDKVLLKISDGSTDSLRDSTCIVTFTQTSEPSFEPDDGSNTSPVPKGYVRVSVGSFDNSGPDVPIVGFAMVNPERTTRHIPVAAWRATPGSVFHVKPSTLWYCARGDKVKPTVVIKPNSYNNPWEADFSKRGTNIYIEYTGSNKFQLQP